MTNYIFGYLTFKRSENIFFYILWKKSRLKSTFLPYHVKKHHSTLEMDTFKIMLLLSYLAHDFKSPFLDIEINIVLKISALQHNSTRLKNQSTINLTKNRPVIS